MKAWLIHGFGDMRLEEVPEPSEIPDGWAKIRVLTVQPSITECLLFRGLPTYNLDLVKRTLAEGPARLFGHEYSGEVVAVGDGVTDLRPGYRVASRSLSSCGACYLCRHGRREECQKGPITGFGIPGCFAEYAVVPGDTLVPVPETISDGEAAAIQALCDAVAGVAAAGFGVGDTCLVIGQGVMGLGAMQAARASGAGIVIVVDVREGVLALSRELGADVVVDARKTDPVEVVLELTRGRGVDVVIEAAGGPPEQGLGGSRTLAQAAQAVKDGGTVVGLALYGEATLLSYKDFRHRSIRYVFPNALTRGLLAHVVQLVASGRVQLSPTITAVLEGIESVPRAFELTEDKAASALINPAQVVVSSRSMAATQRPNGLAALTR